MKGFAFIKNGIHWNAKSCLLVRVSLVSFFFFVYLYLEKFYFRQPHTQTEGHPLLYCDKVAVILQLQSQ